MKAIKKVKIWTTSKSTDDYLFYGYFEKSLSYLLSEEKKINPKNILSLRLNDINENQKGDALSELFTNELFLSWKFASKLMKYDMIDIDCFESKGDIGLAIKEMLTDEIRFMVISKEWHSETEITINIEPFHEDYFINLNEDIINGKYK